jgi:ferric-dicitrate binding protein FerR (iron transport regulator)
MSPITSNNEKETEMLPDPLQKSLETLKVPASSRSKDEAWSMLVEEIQKGSIESAEINRFSLLKSVAIAATLLLIISFSYIKLSTITNLTGKGQQLTVNLPDGSIAILNACSKISYPRYFLLNDRKIKLEGEALFKVKKGKPFLVMDKSGNRVEVLGTQFCVTTRENTFKVQCFEGIVKINNRFGKSLRISRGITAQSEGQEIVTAQFSNDTIREPSWIKGEFYFTASPLSEVFAELMRQFNIFIISKDFNPQERIYTGYFTNKNLKQSLDLVTIPMNLSWKLHNDTIIVSAITPAD